MEDNFTRGRTYTRSMSMNSEGPLPDVFNLLSELNQSSLDSQSLKILNEIKKISEFQKEAIQEVVEKSQAMINDLIWQRDQLINRIKEECSTRATELKQMIQSFQSIDTLRRPSRILKPSYNLPLMDFQKEIFYAKQNWLKKCKLSIKFSENGLEKIQNSQKLTQYIYSMYENISEASTTTQIVINRKLGDDDARHLSHILPHYKNLAILILSSNCLGPRGAKYLAASIPHLRKLYKLSINNDRIKDGILSLIRVLPSLSHLEELYLSTGVFYEREAGDIASALSIMPNLKNFSLLGGILESKGTEKLCYGLFFLPLLKTLDLSGDSLGPAGANILLLTLGNFTDLETLKLSANNFTSSSGEAIGKLITQLEKLEELWLNSNALGDQGVCELVNQGSSQLKILKLQDNGIGNIGAKVVLQKCCEWKKLEVLDLSWNCVDDSIASVFQGNEEKYRTIHLEFCGMNFNEVKFKSFGFSFNV